MREDNLKELLEEYYTKYNRQEYVHPDPLEFLYRYDEIEDREIAGLIAASLAYGRVEQILKSVARVLDPMGSSPRTFIEDASKKRLEKLYCDFRHRFTTADELVRFLMNMKSVVRRHGSLRECFVKHMKPEGETILTAMKGFVSELSGGEDSRKISLVACPSHGSACKKMNLFLRWMVRRDAVDPGGWDEVSPAKLVIPLDVHMHRICRQLGLTRRNAADLKTALEVTEGFKRFAPDDPVKYDFALTRPGIQRITNYELGMKERQ